MNKIIELKKSELDPTRQYLLLLNGILNLTPIEITVLAEFIDIYLKMDDLDVNDRNKITFSTPSRNIVSKNMKFKSKVSVNNYLKVLKDKKVINFADGIYSFSNVVLPPVPLTSVTFRLV